MTTNNDSQSHPPDPDDQAVEDVVRQGPSGTIAVAGVATFLVVAMYFAFYFFIYLPRGAVH
jgi:hypothetical protein